MKKQDGFRVVIKQSKTVKIDKYLFQLYRFLGLIKISKRDKQLGRLRPGIKAQHDGSGGLRFSKETLEPLINYRLGSSAENLERKSPPSMPGIEINFYRFRNGISLTDDLLELEQLHALKVYERHLARVRQLQEQAERAEKMAA